MLQESYFTRLISMTTGIWRCTTMVLDMVAQDAAKHICKRKHLVVICVLIVDKVRLLHANYALKSLSMATFCWNICVSRMRFLSKSLEKDKSLFRLKESSHDNPNNKRLCHVPRRCHFKYLLINYFFKF